jgi:hypothetical protein
MVTTVDDKPFLERLKAQPNRNFRRYNLVLKEGVRYWSVTRSAKLFDEILEELCGPQADQK